MKYNVEVLRIFKVNEIKKITAETKRVFVGSATVSINGVAIANCAVTRTVENKKMKYYHFQMPQIKGKDDNYYNICWINTDTEEASKVYKMITEKIEAAFEDSEE